MTTINKGLKDLSSAASLVEDMLESTTTTQYETSSSSTNNCKSFVDSVESQNKNRNSFNLDPHIRLDNILTSFQNQKSLTEFFSSKVITFFFFFSFCVTQTFILNIHEKHPTMQHPHVMSCHVHFLTFF